MPLVGTGEWREAEAQHERQPPSPSMRRVDWHLAVNLVRTSCTHHAPIAQDWGFRGQLTSTYCNQASKPFTSLPPSTISIGRSPGAMSSLSATIPSWL